MTMITPSYLGETIEYSSLHACRSTLEDPTVGIAVSCGSGPLTRSGTEGPRFCRQLLERASGAPSSGSETRSHTKP